MNLRDEGIIKTFFSYLTCLFISQKACLFISSCFFPSKSILAQIDTNTGLKNWDCLNANLSMCVKINLKDTFCTSCAFKLSVVSFLSVTACLHEDITGSKKPTVH